MTIHFKITTYHLKKGYDDRSNGRKIICLPNKKTMMMKLKQARHENIMKYKVTKNITTYHYKNSKMYSRAKK